MNEHNKEATEREKVHSITIEGAPNASISRLREFKLRIKCSVINLLFSPVISVDTDRLIEDIKQQAAARRLKDSTNEEKRVQEDMFMEHFKHKKAERMLKISGPVLARRYFKRHPYAVKGLAGKKLLLEREIRWRKDGEYKYTETVRIVRSLWRVKKIEPTDKEESDG